MYTKFTQIQHSLGNSLITSAFAAEIISLREVDKVFSINCESPDIDLCSMCHLYLIYPGCFNTIDIEQIGLGVELDNLMNTLTLPIQGVLGRTNPPKVFFNNFGD